MSNIPLALRVGSQGTSSINRQRSGTADSHDTTTPRSETSHALPVSLRPAVDDLTPRERRGRSNTNEDLPPSLRSNTGDRIPVRLDTGHSKLSDLLQSTRRNSSTRTISTIHTDKQCAPSRYGSMRRDDSTPAEEQVEFDSEDGRSRWLPTRASSTNSKYSTVPSLPALPLLTEEPQPLETSPFVAPGRQTQEVPSRTRSILDRIGSVRPGKILPRGRYGQLNDLDEGAADGESVNYDISGFNGPHIEMYNLSRTTVGIQHTHGRGGGMGLVFDATLKQDPTMKHKSDESTATPLLRRAILHEAQKTGEIVAVKEEVFDISGYEGGEQTRLNSRLTLDDLAGVTKKSYFFPEDPEKPAWKPFSMRWPYITILVVIAFALAGMQEFLFQISNRDKSKGLLKFKTARDISIPAYFTWKYLPTMVLVTYSIMWQVLDYEVKRLEPYYQLSKREGATARDSLNLDYLTAITWIIPVRAIRYKQWTVVYSSVASLIAGGLLAVLQSASIETDPRKPREHKTGEYVRVIMDPVYSRLLTAALLVIGFAGIALMIALRRTSGLLSDPQGIAGIASMATKSHILTDFKGLDTASNSDIHNRLRTRRYNLHKASLWQGEFVREADNYVPPEKKENPHPLMLRLVVGVPFMLYIMLVGALIPVFVFDARANVVTAHIPFLLTALATGVKLSWNAMDIELRVMEPYYILSRRHAPPKTLTLDYTGTVPGYLTLKAIINKHWLIASVSFGAILCEVLTVCATSFTVDGKKFVESNDSSDIIETFRSFWTSFALASAILLYLYIVAIIVYCRRSRIFLPRQPGSIAGVLAYIHQSRMLDDFIDTELLDSRQMTRHLEKLGKTYALGWFNGRDKQDHCGVEQEQIAAGYRYGVSFKASRMVGNEVGNWEHY